VKNKKDKCPDTPFGYQVDEEGCIVDADKDGVPDNLDECPDTPLGYQVDEKGCTVDTDKDGVPNNLDKCAGTLNNVPVDEHGCPFDEDGDGVSDSFDKCPKTPAGAVVGRDGCPIDSDGDAVPDYMDKCPGTPVEAKGMIDADGCPKDTDADGVPDYLIKCPGTPVEAQGTVDAKGCPKDTDDDGIPDYLDNCPTIKGTVSDQGCPALKVEEKRIFEKALQGIQFESGKDLIKPVSYTVLNEIVSIMKTNTDYLLDINGHTDNVGDAVKNQELSENRALSVKKYLTSKGIDEGRVNTKGFGDTKPVADNSTVQGRKMNRRVEFVVRFER
jgi:outer membrane protein OmpA-like peptidoglycan-associated protein